MAVATRKVVLTDRGLKALKPAPSGKRYIVWDAMQPHLGVRVTDKGVKSFIVVKRKAGAAHPDTHVLGQFPARALKAARDDAPGIISLLAQGKSPAQAKAEAAREAARRRADTFATAVEKFIDHEEGKGLRSWRETEATLRRDFLGQVPKRERKTTVRAGRNVTEWVTEWTDSKKPAWRDRPIAEITRRDVIERLDEIKARRGKYAARYAHGVPAATAGRFDFAPIEFRRDGSMGHRSRGDHIGNRLPHFLRSPGRSGSHGSNGGRVPLVGPADRCCPVGIAERAAFLGEPLPGHREGFLGTLGDYLALTLGDDGHDANNGFVRVR